MDAIIQLFSTRSLNDGQSLLDAARIGNQDQVANLLASGVDPNTKDESFFGVGSTPLHFASIEGHEAVVDNLLAYGANPNVLDNTSCTPLMHASRCSKYRVALKLLAAGADPELKSRSAIEWSIASDMEALLSNDLSPEQRNECHVRWKQINPNYPDVIRVTDSPTMLISSSHSAPRVAQPVIVIRHLDLIYDAHRPIARGTFGCVYDAFYDKQRVAIKTLYDKAGLADFLQESERMTSLRSSFLVRLIGITLEPQTMVMEFMEGGSLFEVLHLKKELLLNWPLQWDILHQVAQGIQYLHSQSIVHRDLKPGNILLSGDYKQVKLADFGLSRKCNDRGLANTATSHAGTAHYMAPELFASISQQSSLAADIYAYGIIMWEVGFRAIPWHYVHHLETLKNYVNDGLRPNIDESVGHSSEFIGLMVQCWAQEADRRPRMEIVIQSLKACQSIAPGMKPYLASEPSVADPQYPPLHYGDFKSEEFIFGSKSTSVGSSSGPSSSSSSSAFDSMSLSPLPNPNQTWSVRKWIQSLDLSQYCEIFEQNTGTMEDVKNLSMEDLKTELGISNLSHRKKILEYAAKL